MIRIARKLLRGAVKIALGVAAAAALLVGVTWMFLQTRRGGELVQRIALPRVNAAIAGTLTLGRFAFGGDRVTLESVALYDPEARLVARVARIDVSFSPLALLRRRVEIPRLQIRRPELTLFEDERGLNLLRALAPRHGPEAGPARRTRAGGGGARVVVDVGTLVVSDGIIDYRSSAAGARRVRIADLSIRGGAHLGRGRFAADAAVTARGGRADARVAFDAARRHGSGTARASLRGLSIQVDGRVDGDALDARASLDADDLARAARTLARDFGLPRIEISGNGRVDVSCGGTTAAPSLRAQARFPSLAFAGTSARGVTASARMPNLRTPEALDVDARASSVSRAGRRLVSPQLAVRATGRRVTARAEIAAPEPLRIDLEGERRRARAIAIESMSIRTPEATWGLRRPARLALAGDTIELSGFELAAGEQRLAADLHLGGARSTAHVVVSRFDLGRLPRALVPAAAELGLGGTVDADVDVRADRGAAPRAAVTATLKNGRIGAERDLALDLAGRLERGRARGELRARGLGVGATARFDLPDAWPPGNPRAPLGLIVETGDVDLAAVAAAIADVGGRPAARIEGRARATLHLDGSVGRPRLRLAVAGRGLAFDDHRIGDLGLAVNGEGDGALTAEITCTAPAQVRIGLTTPLSLHALLRRPPTPEALARTRFELKGTADRLPLDVLARAARLPFELGGTLSSTLAVSGTLSDPTGRVTADVAGATTAKVPPTDARLEIDLERDAVAARLRVSRRQGPLLAVETRLGLPAGELLRPSRLVEAPVHLRAVLGPYLMHRFGLPPLDSREPPRQLDGRLHADLAVDGTAGAPRVTFHAQAGDIRLDKTEVGFAQIEAGYADRRATLDARLTSRGGGTLRAQASLAGDLGYPALARGLDVRHAPLDVRLDATRFELGGASGAVQALRTVGGLLTASLAMRGTLSEPRVTGRLEWKDGVVAVSGFGQYERIHLAVHGDEHGITLDELAAASGLGTARVTGRATAAGGRGYDVAAEAKLTRFPIHDQGQALAIVSLALRLHGRAARADTQLAADIDDAKIELKDAKRRELQSLDEPADIVLVDAGAPLNRAQADKLRALLEGGRARSAPPRRAPTLHLRVNAPRQLWVSGNDVYLELGLSPNFEVSLAERPEIHGQVTVRRGRVDVFGRRFDIKADSTVSFAGPADHPQLDVRAEHVNTAENITVLLTVKGTPDKISVTVTSPNRPDLGESQLYTLIITGHLQYGSGGGTSTSPSTQAASILGGVLASKLQSALAHRLPFDVLTIDVGGEGVQGTKLEAGRYVTDRVYVGYIGRVGSDPTRYQNRNAVRLEYQIGSRWEIQGEYGDLGTGTADLMWKKNY